MNGKFYGVMVPKGYKSPVSLLREAIADLEARGGELWPPIPESAKGYTLSGEWRKTTVWWGGEWPYPIPPSEIIARFIFFRERRRRRWLRLKR